MSLSANRIRLASATKELAVNWAQTKDYWRDAKSQEFERKFLEDIFNGVETAGGIIEQLDKILNKIRTDCE